MQQRTQKPGGAPAGNVDPALLQESTFNVMKQSAGTSTAALATAAALQQRRAARMNQSVKVLQKTLGEKHPDVAAAQAMAQTAGDLKTMIVDQSKRVKSFPRLRPHEWIVFGTVRDQAGKPAAGLVVRVFDLDRKFDDLLGETETDANGDFSAVYHERDFKESNENLAELYVMVSDAKGALLYTSRGNVRFNAGRAEYFAIRLGTREKGKGRGKPAPKAEAKPAAKPEDKAADKTVDKAADKTVRRKKSSG